MGIGQDITRTKKAAFPIGPRGGTSFVNRVAVIGQRILGILPHIF